MALVEVVEHGVVVRFCRERFVEVQVVCKEGVAVAPRLCHVPGVRKVAVPKRWSPNRALLHLVVKFHRFRASTVYNHHSVSVVKPACQ